MSCFAGVDGVNLLPAWCSHIAKVCQEFNDEHPTAPSVVTFESCPMTLLENFVVPEMYLMPPLILWSPLEQFNKVKIACPKCSVAGVADVSLHARGWRDGMGGTRSEPRKVYGVNGVTLLVGRVYACSKGHEVVGYHPGILKAIPACFIPFKLWHITGFTIEQIQFIASLISFGVSIHKVRDILLERIGRWYHLQKLKFNEVNGGSVHPFPSKEQWSQCFSSLLPSQHAISSSFLADFWSKEDVYVKVMQNTSIDENNSWLSCDHTFASAGKLITKIN